MTQPMRWPNVAMAARDRAAELAVDIVLAMRPLVMGDRQLPENAILRKQAQALSNAQDIVRLMQEQGAPVKMDF